jgi:hypothetical protein
MHRRNRLPVRLWRSYALLFALSDYTNLSQNENKINIRIKKEPR